MGVFKWFAKIEAFQESDQAKAVKPLASFDLNALEPKTTGGKIKSKLGSFLFKKIIPPALRLCQQVWPVPHSSWLNLAIVTRDTDVRAVLEDNHAFGVPYGPEMKDLGDGTIFGLGLDGPCHQRQRDIMQLVMGGEKGEFYSRDMEAVLAHTNACAEALIENGAGRIDAIRDYITRIATETASKYFGLDIPDPDAFAEWSLAASTMLFGDPFGDRNTRDIALNAGARLRLVIQSSLDRAKANYRQHPNSEGRKASIIDRLVKLQADRAKEGHDPISDAEIVAILLGMTTGFVPTNTLAGAKMLSEIVRRPNVWKAILRAASHGRRNELRSIIKEAARFDSALAPGQWRVARKDVVIADGTSHARRVKRGTIVLVSTMTALRDRRRFNQPGKFRTDRDVEGDLMFGFGPHACMGSHMATEQLTSMFMVLFAQPGLQRAKGTLGKMRFVGAFPVRMDMTYRNVAEAQSMVLVVVPVPPDFPVSKDQLDEQLSEFGHPAGPAMRKALDDTGLVHFASLATLETERGVDIVFELSFDGRTRPALARIADCTEHLLRPIFETIGLDPAEPFAQFLHRHVLPLHSYPWGATGVNYNGTGEFSVRTIEKQRRLAEHANTILQDFLGREIGEGNQPLQLLTYVRRIIKGDRFHALLKSSPRHALLNKAAKEGLDTYVLKPSRAKLAVADFDVQTYGSAFFAYLKSRRSLELWMLIGAVSALLLFTLHQIIQPPQVAFCTLPDQLNWSSLRASGCRFEWPSVSPSLWGWAGVLSGTLLATLLIFGAAITTVLLKLRRAEKSEPRDPRQASLEHLRAIAGTEDHPGYAQNHIMAVGQLKPGLFRQFVHAFALWAIKMIIIFYYRPGFVVNMGTIHYARWWRLPGTRTSIFYSNYDGSWDSYLEDFITRARWGQTAAWSNWVGFPEAKYLIFKGAEDGDRFKRWVRTQQKVVPFWYSRFPDLTTDRIRNNALIHHGLARAKTDSEAREWLRHFGSMPRTANRIETHEVQSLVFRGFRNLPYSACLVIKLPSVDDYALSSWLGWLSGKGRYVSERSRAYDVVTKNADLFEDVVTAKDEKRLRQSLCISFGDMQVMGEEGPTLTTSETKGTRTDIVRRAVFFGCGAAGFSKISSSERASKEGLHEDLPGSFPPAFQMGMAARPQILGDHETAAPYHWRWSDTEDNAEKRAAESVLLLYAETEEDLARISAFQADLLHAYGGKRLYQLDCAPTDLGPDFEHFGFRDGISQPVISGTERHVRGAPERDIIEPGEFILGYENNQGFLPPTALVREEADVMGNLPVSSPQELSRFPDFGDTNVMGMPRDFGRNGSYLVLREIEQHVDQFDAFAKRKAEELRGKYCGSKSDQPSYPELLREVGQKVDSDWVKAKIVGRWQDGRPLVGNPVRVKTRSGYRRHPENENGVERMEEISDFRAVRENDFAFGIDDPQGFACPFGAHIRRANPRDSKQPGDVDEQIITNRHRLLRRGRSYQRGDEKGLLFVALCADLERQFEFVQQTWVSSPNFHGLAQEPDPLIAASSGAPRCFTIPTPAGPVKLTGMEQFTTVRGGGYFFLPSRSALLYLGALSRRLSQASKPTTPTVPSTGGGSD